MKDEHDFEQAALRAGSKVLHGLTILAGGLVAITAICASLGFFYFFGYLATIGAPWVKDLLSVTLLIKYGAPVFSSITSATLIAMLIYGRSREPIKVRYVLTAWFVIMLLGGLAIVKTEWQVVPFIMQIATGIAAAIVVPSYLIWMARAWKGRDIGVVAFLINLIAVGTLVPLFAGILIGSMNRVRPQSLSAVVLESPATYGQEWRMVLASEEWFLLTRVENRIAFREFKIVATEQIDTIYPTLSGAPWAPQP